MTSDQSRMDASPGNRADHPQQHALSVIADMPVGEIQTCVTDDETPWSTGVPSGLRETQALTSDADPAAAGRAPVAHYGRKVPDVAQVTSMVLTA